MIKQENKSLGIKSGLIFLGSILLLTYMSFQMIGLKDYLLPFLSQTKENFEYYLNQSNQAVIEIQPPADPCLITLEDFGQELVPERLIIESVGINLPVISVPLENGTWRVTDRVANYAQGTSLINGRQGNVGLFGHDKPLAFSKIKDVKVGEKIVILAGNYLVRYVVEEGLIVEPSQVNVFYPTDSPTLTLATCDGRFSERRFVTSAKLESIEKLSCYQNVMEQINVI
ncbi:sortase [Patescibacteria group bacterium]